MPPAPFFSAPHRLMFAAGAFQALATVLFWALDLGGRMAGLYAPLSWSVPSVWLHAGLMIYGLFTFFIFGFLLTALPKWVSAPALQRHDYLPVFWLSVAGWLLFYIGFLFRPLLPLGLLFTLLGGAWAVRVLWRAANMPLPKGVDIDRSHAQAIVCAVAFGGVGLSALAIGLARLDAAWLRAGIELGVWCYLLPVFFIVSHRMLPFFSASALRGYVLYRPMPVLWLLLFAFGAHGVFAVIGHPAWALPADLLAAGLAMHCSWKWQLRKSFAVPMVAMLHVATLWLGLGLALYVVHDLLLLLGHSAGLGLAPLHAITIGYFASMMLGMATRVTRGHSGRPIDGYKLAWPLFWALQSVPLLRLLGEGLVLPGVFNLTWLAALAWLLVFGTWAREHLAMYFRPRPDGQPG